MSNDNRKQTGLEWPNDQDQPQLPVVQAMLSLLSPKEEMPGKERPRYVQVVYVKKIAHEIPYQLDYVTWGNGSLLKMNEVLDARNIGDEETRKCVSGSDKDDEAKIAVNEKLTLS